MVVVRDRGRVAMGRRGQEALNPLSRAIAVLEEVAQHRTAPSFSTLLQRTALPKSSLHRILKTLVEERLLEFSPEENGYRLGLRLAGLSLKAIHGLGIRDAVRPEIETLSRALQENVLVAQRDDTQLVYVDRIQSQQTLQMISQLGNNAPLHCTGLGKVLLAFSDPVTRAGLLTRLTLTRFTENTLCTTEALAAELAAIREAGFAVDRCEHQPEVHCIAAPIARVGDMGYAAISISAPVFRVSHERLLSWLPQLLDTAATITLKLGGVVSADRGPSRT